MVYSFRIPVSLCHCLSTTSSANSLNCFVCFVRSSRIFWSTSDVTKCCHYTCTVTIQGETSTESDAMPTPTTSPQSSTQPTASLSPDLATIHSALCHHNYAFSFSPLTTPQKSPRTPQKSPRMSRTPTSGTSNTPTSGNTKRKYSKARRQLLTGSRSRKKTGSLSHVTKGVARHNLTSIPNVTAVNLFPQPPNQTTIIPMATLQQALVQPVTDRQMFHLVTVPVSPGVFQVVSIMAANPTNDKQPVRGERSGASQSTTRLPRLLPKPVTSISTDETLGLLPRPHDPGPSMIPGVGRMPLSEASGQSGVTSSPVISLELQRLRHIEAQQLGAKKTIESTQHSFLR